MWLSVPSSFTIFHRSCAAFYHIKSSLHSPCHCALSSLYLREYIYSYLEPFFLPFVSKIFLFLKIYYYQIFLQIRIGFSKGHNGVEARTPKNEDRQPVFNFTIRFHRRIYINQGLSRRTKPLHQVAVSLLFFVAIYRDASPAGRDK